MAPASGECLGRLFALDRLPQQGVAERDQDRAPQDGRGGLAPAGGRNRSWRCKILRGCRGDTCRASAPRRAYDLKGGSRRRHEAVLVSGMQKIVHTMRDKLGLPTTFTLDACRHGGMTELEEAELYRWSRSRSFRAQKSASLRGLRNAHDQARARGDPQAACSCAGERGKNKHSE